MKPQDYGSRTEYRPPAAWYQRLNRVGARVVGLGLAPRNVVTLEVPGRRSGKMQRIPIVITPYEGIDYLVSLAGESQWVRNVRAAEGQAALRRARIRPVTLTEIEASERSPVIAEYLRQGRQRSGDEAAVDQARFYFGLEADATRADIEAIAVHYPVFRIDYDR